MQSGVAGGWGQAESLLEPPVNHGPSVLPTIYEQPSSSTVHHLDQNRASAMSVDTYSEAFSDQDPQHWENPQTRNLTAAPSATGSPIPRQQHISIAEAAEAAARQQDRVSLASEARHNQEETRVPLNDYSAGLQSFMASPAPQNGSLHGLAQRDPNAPKKISTASAFAAQYEASTKRNRQPTKSPQQPAAPAKPGKVTWRDDQPLFEGARPPAPIPSDTTWVTSGGNAWSNRHRSAPDGSFINQAQLNNEAWQAELQHYRAAEQLSQKEYAARQARAMQQSQHSKHHSFPAVHPMIQQPQQQRQKRPSAQQNQSWQGWGRPEGDGESESDEGTVTGHGWGQQDQWGTTHKGGMSQGKRNERNGHAGGVGWGQTNDAWGSSGWGQEAGGARGKENTSAWGQEGDGAWSKENTGTWGQEGGGAWGKENAGAWGQEGGEAWGQENAGAWGQATGASGGAWGQAGGNDGWGQQGHQQGQKHTSNQPQHAGQQGDRHGQHPHGHQMQQGHHQMQGQQGHRVSGHVQNHHQGHSRHGHSQHGHPAMWDGDEEESEDQWGEEDETEDEDDGWGANGGAWGAKQDDWGVNGHQQPKVTFKVGGKNDISAHDRSQILNSLLKQTQSQHNPIAHGNAQQHAAAHAKKAQQHQQQLPHHQHKDLGHWEATADKGWGSIADEGEYEGNRRVHFSPKASEIWGGSPRPVPSKTLAQARQGVATTLINDASDVRFVDSRGAAFDYVSNAFFGNSRFARERIHWLFPPNKDPRVEGMLAWVQKMSFNLGTYGVRAFESFRDIGLTFTVAFSVDQIHREEGKRRTLYKHTFPTTESSS